MQEKEVLHKVRSKPLHLTQIEEQAIEELKRLVFMVHPQNVRFQNVRFQNVWNVRFTKRQVYKISGLQNVRFTKRQVFKTSGCKKTSIYILYLWLVEIRRFCDSHVFRQSDGSVLFSILEGCFAIYHYTVIASNK